MESVEGLSAAIQTIAGFTAEKFKTVKLDLPGERAGVYALVGPDGEVDVRVAEPSWHHETLSTPGDLVAFIAKHGSEESAVFYSETAINFVYNLSDRRNLATCPLKISPQYAWLLNPKGPMRQADFIRLLRIQFRGCLSADNNLLGVIRNLKFSTAADGGADIQHGRESIGKSIKAAITGEGAIPEECKVFVPVFENFNSPVPVSCAIEVFPQEQNLQLTPYPLEVQRAMDETLGRIKELFSAEGAPPVYRGAP